MKQQAKEKMIVIFRKFKDGDVIAFFPTETGSNDLWTCESYMHVGQHSSASTDLITSLEKCTHLEQYDLFQELNGIYGTAQTEGDTVYQLIIKERNHSSYFEKRRQKLINR